MNRRSLCVGLCAVALLMTNALAAQQIGGWPLPRLPEQAHSPDVTLYDRILSLAHRSCFPQLWSPEAAGDSLWRRYPANSCLAGFVPGKEKPAPRNVARAVGLLGA